MKKRHVKRKPARNPDPNRAAKSIIDLIARRSESENPPKSKRKT
jgi:hypothetical protein